jgi:streptogramin lyase
MFVLAVSIFSQTGLSQAPGTGAGVPGGPISIRGKVRANSGPIEGAYVAAHASGKTFTTYVLTDSTGQYAFRGLAPGDYEVFTRIPGFRDEAKSGLTVEGGKEAVADFEVEAETEFLKLVEQASNAELTESYPLSPEETRALDYRCGDCHGARYIAKSRFTQKDWGVIIAKMSDQAVTPAGDPAPPTRAGSASNRDPALGPPGSDDASIARILASFRGPTSPDFPIKFRPRASGELTRAVVTEYQIPRLGATPRFVVVDPRGRYVWYSDWRANFLGRIEIATGEVKEYSIPGRDDRPPGLQETTWDPQGMLWAGQIWSGRAVRFDVVLERVAGIWAPPQEWVRLGGVTMCHPNPDGSVTYMVGDSLVSPGGSRWTLNPDSGQFTQLPRAEGGPPSNSIRKGTGECESSDWYGGWRQKRSIFHRDPKTGRVTEFPMVAPWARPFNAVGDAKRQVGWAAPDVSGRVIKADLRTGRVTEFPLPSHGKEIRNIDIEETANPPAFWFVNQRLGRIIRFQEYTE